MSKLDSAIQRFNSALERLEKVAQGNGPATQAKPMAFEQEISVEFSALKEDRARLADELTRLNVEKIALEGFTDEVAGRLEGAIREIRAVLAH
jgi:predicted  nucleic acid-binding Zn-ribbon protein